jgi:hypothetical protein
MSSKILQLTVRSSDLSQAEYSCYKLSNSQNDNYLHSPPIDLHLIFEKSSLKNQLDF